MLVSDHRRGACSSRAHFASDNSIAAGRSDPSNKKSVKSDIRMVNLQTTKVRLNIVFCNSANSAIRFDLFVSPMIFNMQLWLVFSFVLLDRERKFHVSRIDMSTVTSIRLSCEEVCKIGSNHVVPSDGGEVVIYATSSFQCMYLSQIANCICLKLCNVFVKSAATTL